MLTFELSLENPAFSFKLRAKLRENVIYKYGVEKEHGVFKGLKYQFFCTIFEHFCYRCNRERYWEFKSAGCTKSTMLFIFCWENRRIGFIIWEREDWYSFIWIFCLRIRMYVFVFFSIWGSRAPESMNHSELLYIITSHCYRKHL